GRFTSVPSIPATRYSPASASAEEMIEVVSAAPGASRGASAAGWQAASPHSDMTTNAARNIAARYSSAARAQRKSDCIDCKHREPLSAFVIPNLGLSSIERDDGGSEVDCAEEGYSALVISGADGAEGFEFGEEVLDQV